MVGLDSVSISLSTFVLIALAEMGDKSQLVCMVLAARYRAWPVISAASLAFLLLNTLAVLFGAVVADWLPERVMAALVALLFGFFGLQSLLHADEDDEGEPDIEQKSSHGIFLTTFMLLLVAEFGDKTQLAVAGLALNYSPIPVWVGASLALILVSVLGVWVGRTLLQRFKIAWLHRIGGVLFLFFALLAAWKAIA